MTFYFSIIINIILASTSAPAFAAEPTCQKLVSNYEAACLPEKAGMQVCRDSRSAFLACRSQLAQEEQRQQARRDREAAARAQAEVARLERQRAEAELARAKAAPSPRAVPAAPPKGPDPLGRMPWPDDCKIYAWPMAAQGPSSGRCTWQQASPLAVEIHNADPTRAYVVKIAGIPITPMEMYIGGMVTPTFTWLRSWQELPRSLKGLVWPMSQQEAAQVGRSGLVKARSLIASGSRAYTHLAGPQPVQVVVYPYTRTPGTSYYSCVPTSSGGCLTETRTLYPSRGHRAHRLVLGGDSFTVH